MQIVRAREHIRLRRRDGGGPLDLELGGLERHDDEEQAASTVRPMRIFFSMAFAS